MRALFVLFLKYGGIILFVILEAVCMFLVVEYNQKQGEIYTTSHKKWIGGIYNQAEDFAQYLKLSAINDSLAAENARLYAQLDNAKYINTLQIDSAYVESTKQRYTYISTKVINSSYTNHNNFLTLDKGTEDGIHADMGIISSFGVVGIITSASEKYSVALSVLHRDARISAGIRGSNYHGGIIWEGTNPNEVKLVDVPKHAVFEKGDTIQTTGYSTYFPAEIMIGKITDFDLESGSNFYDIDVELSNDLTNIQYVYVVNHLQQEEIKQLEEEGKNE